MSFTSSTLRKIIFFFRPFTPPIITLTEADIIHIDLCININTSHDMCVNILTESNLLINTITEYEMER